MARLESLSDVTALVGDLVPLPPPIRHPPERVATRSVEDTSELTYDPSSIGKRRESKSGAFGRGYG